MWRWEWFDHGSASVELLFFSFPKITRRDKNNNVMQCLKQCINRKERKKAEKKRRKRY